MTWRRLAVVLSGGGVDGTGDVALFGGGVEWQRRRRARPGLAQMWAITGALDGGGGSRA